MVHDDVRCTHSSQRTLCFEGERSKHGCIVLYLLRMVWVEGHMVYVFKRVCTKRQQRRIRY